MQANRQEASVIETTTEVFLLSDEPAVGALPEFLSDCFCVFRAGGGATDAVDAAPAYSLQAGSPVAPEAFPANPPRLLPQAASCLFYYEGSSIPPSSSQGEATWLRSPLLLLSACQPGG